MSRTIEAIMPRVMRLEEQSVAPIHEINPNARWRKGLETIFRNAERRVRFKRIQSTINRRIATVGVGLLLAFAQGAIADEEPGPADEKALQQQNDAFVAAFNRGDVKAVAEAYAPDADFLSAQGQRIKGRDALEKYFAKGFAASTGQRLRHSDCSVRFLKPDVAIADGIWEITGRAEGSPARGHYTAILMKRDGQWLIVYDRPMVPVQPPRH